MGWNIQAKCAFFWAMYGLVSTPRAQSKRECQSLSSIHQKICFAPVCIPGKFNVVIWPFRGTLGAKTPIFGARDRKSHYKQKSRITRKRFEIEKKLLYITYRKLGSGFPNPSLFWLPWQRGWAKRYIAHSVLTQNAPQLNNSKTVWDTVKVCINQ